MTKRPPLVLLVASLLAGCVSNPTPHPQQYDAADSLPSVADTATGGRADEKAVCAELGGIWAEDASVCQGVEASFDGAAGAPPDAVSPAANVTDVTVTGEPLAYVFAVTIASDDVDCTAYADWWEVVKEDGTLAGRRILEHPHAKEQPFTRSGDPMAIDADDRVVVRAHFSSTGYGGQVFVGTVKGGFTPALWNGTFAAGLATYAPLPSECAPE